MTISQKIRKQFLDTYSCCGMCLSVCPSVSPKCFCHWLSLPNESQTPDPPCSAGNPTEVSTTQVNPPRVVVRLINGICINLFMKGREIRQAGMFCLTRCYLAGHLPVSIARSPSPAMSPLSSISELCTTRALHSL